MYSQDVHWLGKTWHEFYSIPSSHSGDAYVDPFDDYIEENSTGQEVEENVQEKEHAPIAAEDTSFEKMSQLQQGQEAMTQNLWRSEWEDNRILLT